MQGGQSQERKKMGGVLGLEEQRHRLVCTVSPELCGAGSRVKTRGTGLDRVLLGRDDVRGATLKWGRRRKVSYLHFRAQTSPPNH